MKKLVTGIVLTLDPDFSPSTGDAISADSAGDVWVVGSTFDAATGATVPETLRFNGTAWTVVPVAQPDETSASLNAITVVSPDNAWAVGASSANQGLVLSHG